MADWTAFLAGCVATGTMLLSACALTVVPLAAWLLIRSVVPMLHRMGQDCAWQAPLAAAAATIPGGLVLALGAAAMVNGFHSPCLQTPQGKVLFAVIWTALIVSLLRAVLRIGRRQHEARVLIAASLQPSKRLRRAARRSGITARELPDAQPFCALAGILHPVVVMSTATLGDLHDGELEAALLHERGHARRGDQVVAAVLTFLVDLLPLPAGDLVLLYREAREVAADQHALRSTSANDLAGALLAFARGQRTIAHTAALPGETGLRRRLRLLLRESAPTSVALHRRFLVALVLAAVMAGGLAPAGAIVLLPPPCGPTAGVAYPQR